MSIASGRSGLRLEQENTRLAAENDRLARTIDRLQHDPVFIQDLIRQELNFVKKNEIIFQFPPEKPAPRRICLPPPRRDRRPRPRVQAISAGKAGTLNGSPDLRKGLLKEGQPPPGMRSSPVTIV